MVWLPGLKSLFAGKENEQKRVPEDGNDCGNIVISRLYDRVFGRFAGILSLGRARTSEHTRRDAQGEDGQPVEVC